MTQEQIKQKIIAHINKPAIVDGRYGIIRVGYYDFCEHVFYENKVEAFRSYLDYIKNEGITEEEYSFRDYCEEMLRVGADDVAETADGVCVLEDVIKEHDNPYADFYEIFTDASTIILLTPEMVHKSRFYDEEDEENKYYILCE